MIQGANQIDIFDNPIEDLFYKYCKDNEIDLSKRNIDDNDAYCIWEYIYRVLFKPDKDTVRVNNKNSKLNYEDIGTLHDILDTYLRLCFSYKVLPLIEDFCTLTGISRDTLNSWERGEHRQAAEGATLKHSDIAKKIRDATQRMTIKNLNGNPIGQQSIANNYEGAGLLFAQKEIQAKADAWLIPRERPQEIVSRRTSGALPQFPDFD